MFKVFFILGLFASAGCAVNTVYDPLQIASNQTLLVNGIALRQVTVGMKEDDVRRIMGEKLVIGYSYQNPAMAESSVLADKPKRPSEEPITIPNPYKVEYLSVKGRQCAAEYYVTMVHTPDGQVSQDELYPIVLCNKAVAGKGWDDLKRLTKSSP